MKAKIIAIISFILIASMLLSAQISAVSNEWSRHLLEEAESICADAGANAYFNTYKPLLTNILLSIDVDETKANAVVDVLQRGQNDFKTWRVLKEDGDSLSDYYDTNTPTVQSNVIPTAVAYFDEACSILDMSYTMSLLPASKRAHIGDVAINLFYIGGKIATIDGDKISLPTPPSVGTGSSQSTHYTVKFDSNGGSDVPKQLVKRNKTTTEPEAPVKEGFEFAGWYKDKELTIKYDFSEKVKGATTLYAKWIEIVPDEPTVPAWDNPYNDVNEGDWFYDAVKTITEAGAMNGVADGTFAPDAVLTRGMFVTILYRLEGSPLAGTSAFEDVAPDAWYAKAVAWASANGIVTGFNDQEYRPDISITREQMAAILFRYANYKGMDAVTLEENLHFEDADTISEYAVPAMNWAVGKGIIQGHNNKVTPRAYATRAQAATVFVRYFGL